MTRNNQLLSSKPPLHMPVNKWKLSPSIINCGAMTVLNCVIVHISACRALTGEDTGGHTDVTVWKRPGGFKMPGRINSPPAMTAARCLDPQPDSCPHWLWYERAGEADGDGQEGERRKGWREPKRNRETARKRMTAFYNQGQNPDWRGVCMIDSALLLISQGRNGMGQVCAWPCLCVCN